MISNTCWQGAGLLSDRCFRAALRRFGRTRASFAGVSTYVGSIVTQRISGKTQVSSTGAVCRCFLNLCVLVHPFTDISATIVQAFALGDARFLPMQGSRMYTCRSRDDNARSESAGGEATHRGEIQIISACITEIAFMLGALRLHSSPSTVLEWVPCQCDVCVVFRACLGDIRTMVVVYSQDKHHNNMVVSVDTTGVFGMAHKSLRALAFAARDTGILGEKEGEERERERESTRCTAPLAPYIASLLVRRCVAGPLLTLS